MADGGCEWLALTCCVCKIPCCQAGWLCRLPPDVLTAVWTMCMCVGRKALRRPTAPHHPSLALARLPSVLCRFPCCPYLSSQCADGVRYLTASPPPFPLSTSPPRSPTPSSSGPGCSTTCTWTSRGASPRSPPSSRSAYRWVAMQLWVGAYRWVWTWGA